MMIEREKVIPSYDGTSIWYRVIGSKGQPLVLCDGLGCSGFIWKYLLRDFQDRYRIIHWNYRGHGHSGPPKDESNLGVEVNVQDLQAVLKSAGIRKKPIILGHSLGVQVALEFTRRYSDRVKGVVALNGSYGDVLNHVHDTNVLRRAVPGFKLAAILAPNAMRFLWRKTMGSAVAFYYAQFFEINSSLAMREDILPYFRELQDIDPRLFFKTLSAVANHSVESYLPTMTVPTLIVASEKDKFTPFRFSRKMHNLIPNSELVVLPNGSHIGPLELPEFLNPKIDEFVSRCD